MSADRPDDERAALMTSALSDAAVASSTKPLTLRPRRRPWLIATGALLAAVGALGVVWLVGAAGQRQEVLVIRTAVSFGERIEDSDLGVARVSIDPGIATVPADQRSALVGKTAITALVPGMVMAPGLVAPSVGPEKGYVLVPLALSAERMPASGLRPGDTVLAVASDALDGGGQGVVSTPADVVKVGTPDVNGVTVVDLSVPATQGPGLAVAAAEDRVSIVVTPAGG